MSRKLEDLRNKNLQKRLLKNDSDFRFKLLISDLRCILLVII